MPVIMKVIQNREPKYDEFQSTWKIIQQLRKVKDAPVDLWGCDKVVDKSAPREVFEFQILVAAMLSSQTKDQMVKRGMDSLLVPDLSVEGILSLTEAEIDEKIKMVGFHTTKARNIRAVAQIIKTEHSGRVPADFEQLVSFPGVGPKMANLVMSCAFNQTSGICVDTHVHRISSELGWGCKKCKPSCKNPEHTRAELEAWLPRDMWREFTYLLVGLGQMQQGARETLLTRCLQLADPFGGIKLLKRIKFNFRNLDIRAIADKAGIDEQQALDYIGKLR
jgi:endonuclease-3